MTLALVLDGCGFVRGSQVFAGNASEPATHKQMLDGLSATPGAVVVMDAGIATEANLKWLRERCFDPDQASEVVSAGQETIRIHRVIDAQGHVLLFCTAIRPHASRKTMPSMRPRRRPSRQC